MTYLSLDTIEIVAQLGRAMKTSEPKCACNYVMMETKLRVYASESRLPLEACHLFKDNNRNVIAENFAARKPRLSDLFKGCLRFTSACAGWAV